MCSLWKGEMCTGRMERSLWFAAISVNVRVIGAESGWDWVLFEMTLFLRSFKGAHLIFGRLQSTGVLV